METIRLFCDVVQHKSFSQAAAAHGITQSAASQRIHNLEKELGFTLFDRSVRPPALTAAGEAFFVETSDMLDRYDRLTGRLRAGAENLRGIVRVDAIYSAGIEWLASLREQFEAKHPTVRVIVSYRRPDEVHDSVLSQHCDVGIVSYPKQWRDVVCVPLRDEEMGLVCGMRHALAGRDQIEASELAEWSLVCFGNDLPAGRQVRQYLKDQGCRTTITNDFDNVDTIKSVVAVTEQVAILPLRTVKREVDSGLLHALRLEPTLVRPMGLITRRRRKTSPALAPAIQHFIDFMRKQSTDEDSAAMVQTVATAKNGART